MCLSVMMLLEYLVFLGKPTPLVTRIRGFLTSQVVRIVPEHRLRTTDIPASNECERFQGNKGKGTR